MTTEKSEGYRSVGATFHRPFSPESGEKRQSGDVKLIEKEAAMLSCQFLQPYAILFEYVRIGDLADLRLLHVLQGQRGPVTSLVFFEGGSRLATGSADETIRIWSAATSEHQQSLISHRSGVIGLAFSAATHLIISAVSSDSVRIWSLKCRGIRFQRVVPVICRSCDLSFL